MSSLITRWHFFLPFFKETIQEFFLFISLEKGFFRSFLKGDVLKSFLPVSFFGAKKGTKEASTSSKPPPIWGGLTDYGQNPPSVRFLVSLASLCPTGER